MIKCLILKELNLSSNSSEINTCLIRLQPTKNERALSEYIWVDSIEIKEGYKESPHEQMYLLLLYEELSR